MKTTQQTTRIGLFRDPYYAPCSYLLIKLDEDGCHLPYHGEDEANSILIQSDWDFPSVAMTFGAGELSVSGAGEWLAERAARADLFDYPDISAEDPGYFNL